MADCQKIKTQLANLTNVHVLHNVLAREQNITKRFVANRLCAHLHQEWMLCQLINLLSLSLREKHCLDWNISVSISQFSHTSSVANAGLSVVGCYTALVHIEISQQLLGCHEIWYTHSLLQPDILVMGCFALKKCFFLVSNFMTSCQKSLSSWESFVESDLKHLRKIHRK